MNKRGARGFTLTEVSTVVVILTILAVIAGATWTRYRRTARVSEATNMTGAIRSAQQAYQAENGVYANVSRNQTSYYPAAAPGKFVTAWGGDCAGCYAAQSWSSLDVHPNAPVAFGYATVAGVGADAASMGAAGPLIIGERKSHSSKTVGAADPYFISVAYGDLDGDGHAVRVLGYSQTNDIVVVEGP